MRFPFLTVALCLCAFLSVGASFGQSMKMLPVQSPELETPYRFPGVSLERVLVDLDGTPRVGTNSGLNRYDPSVESLIHYRHERDDDRSGMLPVDCGRSWSSGNGLEEGGLNRFDRKSERWWSRILVITLICAMGVGTYRSRVARIREVEQTRNRIADDLHDDLGSRLSTIALINEAAAHDLTLNGSIKNQLNEAAQIARRAGDDLRDVIWIVDSGRDRLSDLLARLKKVGRQMLQGREHRIVVPACVPDVAVPMEGRRNILLIYKEALHNAVRHANGGAVEVAVELDDRRLSIRVEDAGQGFDLDGVDEGRGLRTMHERAHQIGAQLEVESSPESGTTVHLVTENGIGFPGRRYLSTASRGARR